MVSNYTRPSLKKEPVKTIYSAFDMQILFGILNTESET